MAEHDKRQEPQNDSWGNTYNKDFNRKKIEASRVKRMRELNDENGVLMKRIGDLMDRIHSLEDTIVEQKDHIDALKEDLTVAEAKVIEKKRSRKKTSKALEKDS